MDAIGVTETAKGTDVRPLERKPTVAFDNLLSMVAFGSRDPDTLTTLASRISRLDRQIDESDRQTIRDASGGRDPSNLANALLDAVDPDKVRKQAAEESATDSPTEAQIQSNSKHVSEVRKGYAPFQEEDVILAKITPCMENGKVAVARGLKNGVGFGSSEFHVIRPHGFVSRDYLFYFLVRSDFRKDAERNMTGSAGQRRVPTSYIKEAPLPLPPLNEQRRIVEKVEELFTKLDAGVQSLKQTQALLKSYRRSVLKAAVEGELSREWREAHMHELEPASELLVRILQERREKYAAKKYKEPALPDTSELPKLPDVWTWARMQDISDALGGFAFKSKNYSDTGYPDSQDR